MTRRPIVVGLVFAFLAFGCEQRRRRRRAKPPEPPKEEREEEGEPELVPDDALTLGNLPEIRGSNERVLYVVPFEPQARGGRVPGPPLSWAVAWGQGAKLEDWEELPWEGELQVIFFRRLLDKGAHGPIRAVIAYDDRISLEDLGARSQILKLAGARSRKKAFEASLVSMKQLGIVVPENVKRAKRR